MERCLQIVKKGIFYEAYGDDAIVLSYITGYKLRTHQLRAKYNCGFPNNAIDKVISICKEKHVFAEVYVGDEVTSYKEGNNEYENVLTSADSVYETALIRDKILDLSDENLILLYNYALEKGIM